MSRPARNRLLLAAWFAVALLHGLMGWLLARSMSNVRDPSTRPAARTAIRLLPPTRPLPQQPRPSPPDAITAQRATAMPTAPSRTAPAAPPVGSDRPPDRVGSSDAPSPVEPAASRPERSLDLRVRSARVPPPGSTRAEVLRDPRANSRGATPEVRMAQNLGGDGRLVEQNIGDGRRRFHQNGTCIESRPSRAAQLDRYADNVPHPNLMSSCN